MNKNTKIESVLNAFLEALRLSPSTLPLKKSLVNHPNPNSLVAISDILNEKSIKNTTLLFPETDRDKLLDIPTPFISHTLEGGFIVVKKITHSIVEYYSAIIGEITEDWTVFKNQCTGVALLAFPEENNKSPKISFSKIIEYTEKYIPKILVIIFSVALIGISINFYYLYHSWVLVGLLLFKSIGLIITIFLFLFEYQQTDSLVHEVCKATKTDCNKVLNNKSAKLFGLISWSELGFVYFVGSLLTLFMSEGHLSDSLNLLFSINIPCLLFSFYSIWFQVFKAKEACIFCLSVIAIFWIEFFLFSSFFDFHFHFGFGSLNIFPSFLLGFTLPVSFIYVFKLLWEKYSDWDKIKTQLNTIKFNKHVVKSLTDAQVERPILGSNPFIIFGEKTAKNTLTLVTNPGCGPCAKRHEELIQYMNGCYEDLKINIIFSLGQYYSRHDSEIYKVGKRISAIYKYQSSDKAMHCLDDWYILNMPYEKLIVKYPVENEDVDDLLSSHFEWCVKNEIQYTPTVIFNDRELPKNYSIDDIKYLMA